MVNLESLSVVVILLKIKEVFYMNKKIEKVGIRDIGSCGFWNCFLFWRFNKVDWIILLIFMVFSLSVLKGIKYKIKGFFKKG